MWVIDVGQFPIARTDPRSEIHNRPPGAFDDGASHAIHSQVLPSIAAVQSRSPAPETTTTSPTIVATYPVLGSDKLVWSLSLRRSRWKVSRPRAGS